MSSLLHETQQVQTTEIAFGTQFRRSDTACIGDLDQSHCFLRVQLSQWAAFQLTSRFCPVSFGPQKAVGKCQANVMSLIAWGRAVIVGGLARTSPLPCASARHLLVVCRLRASPEVSQGLVVLDLAESRVACGELDTDAPDGGACIQAAFVFSCRSSGLVADLFVDLAIGGVRRRAPGQQFDDPILAECQGDIDIIPERTSFNRVEQQPAAPLQASLYTGSRCGVDDKVEAPDKDVEAAGLVDEVGGAREESTPLVLHQGIGRQEDDGIVDFPSLQLDEQFGTGKTRQLPVENDGIRRRHHVSRREERLGVGECQYTKALDAELCLNQFAEHRVIFDQHNTRLAPDASGRLGGGWMCELLHGPTGWVRTRPGVAEDGSAGELGATILPPAVA